MQVPKYLSQQWAKATGRGEVGKLRICKYVKHLGIIKMADMGYLYVVILAKQLILILLIFISKERKPRKSRGT